MHGSDAPTDHGNDLGGAIHGITNAYRMGRAIRQARRARRLTQAQLASDAGISRFCLRDLESGARSVGVVNLFQVLSALGYETALIAKPPEISDMAELWETDA